MTETNTTPVDDGADSLWMVTRPKKGDVIVKWRELTYAERDEAIANHIKLYGLMEGTACES